MHKQPHMNFCFVCKSTGAKKSNSYWPFVTWRLKPWWSIISFQHQHFVHTANSRCFFSHCLLCSLFFLPFLLHDNISWKPQPWARQQFSSRLFDIFTRISSPNLLSSNYTLPKRFVRIKIHNVGLRGKYGFVIPQVSQYSSKAQSQVKKNLADPDSLINTITQAV